MREIRYQGTFGVINCVTGKTTTAASFSYGLAEKGYKTVVIDFDIGLRNLDVCVQLVSEVACNYWLDRYILDASVV